MTAASTMLDTPPSWPGLARPLVVPLLEFNLLPSRTLHPEHAESLIGAVPKLLRRDANVERQLHRKWSAQLLERLGPARSPVLDWSEPALPLALAAPALLSRLARDIGIALIGPALRRLVRRDEVLAARTDLGEAGMAWALGDARLLHEGLVHADRWRTDGFARAADTLGAALISQAWQDAPDPLRLRADWKLSASVGEPGMREASGLASGEARSLCIKCLSGMDSKWLSCFPATP